MKSCSKIFWMLVIVVAATAIFDRSNCAKLLILEENSINKVLPISRLRRQTHPASTIAKLPTQDNVFIPIVGPTQSANDQQRGQNNLDFSNTDTLVDYLLPPNPNAQFTSLNFQDPSANLQNIDSFFDVTPTSSSNSINTFQSVSNQFPSSVPNFQINVPTPTHSAASDQVQSISFQNAPIPPSQTFSSPAQPSNQFIQNKESNPFSRELNNNQFKPNNLVKSDPIAVEQPNQGKWDLGFDANDILAPPNPETGRANEYDTINGNRFKKLNIQPIQNNNIDGPLPPNNFQSQNNFQPPNQFNQVNNQFTQPTNQFQQPNQFQSNNQFFPNQFPSQNNFNQFNQPPVNNQINNQFVPPTPQFTQQNPVPASNNQIPVPTQFPSNNDIIWGTQKQLANFNPTTSAPFLPTIPPNTNTQTSSNFQNNFNQNLQQFPSTQLNSDQIYQLPNHPNHQNFPLDTPLTSQFDSFLPQGTVSDHSFFPVNENLRHFQHKREIDDEEEHEEEADEQIQESQSVFGTAEIPNYKNLPYVPRVSRREHHEAGPVRTYQKTNHHAHFTWGVKHNVGHGF